MAICNMRKARPEYMRQHSVDVVSGGLLGDIKPSHQEDRPNKSIGQTHAVEGEGKSLIIEVFYTGEITESPIVLNDWRKGYIAGKV